MQLHRIASAAKAASLRSKASLHAAAARLAQAQAVAAGFSTAPALRDACFAGKSSPCPRTAELLRRADTAAETDCIAPLASVASSVRDSQGSIKPLLTPSLSHLAVSSPSTEVDSGIEPLPVPWRITLDTNPDDCNLSCVMCEQHSVYSDAQAKREAAGIRRRRMKPGLIDDVLEGLPIGPDGVREVIPSTMGE